MKQPRHDLTINTIIHRIGSYKRHFFLLLIALVVFSSCKNDLEKIHLFDEETVIPDLSGKDITILRSDSGMLKVRVYASEIRRFDNVDEPYMEFPKGIEVYFLDSVQEVKTSIIAKYAIRYNEQELYYARDSVVATNVQTGEWIKSEEMYWDEKRGKVYSNKFTTINREDGLWYGHDGFRSSQDFSDWVLLKTSTGTLKLSEDGQKK